ncbi:unnamed protein product [Candidula unifasciata]|uniref:CNNM transmembrane domain-containing protein n=1 Tax=Candidula unifasciata TaxID=100452 RepID=A0A8S3ZWX5_9EUPU|nr:unnamed protein product [Candidula unifasciata]
MEELMLISCSLISDHVIICNGTEYSLPETVLTFKDAKFWVYIGVYIALTSFAGVMSGLTIGLLSLDLTTLITMKDGGTPNERKYAARILPVVKQHHLLLVTLLLSNSAAVEAMPIFLDRISNPILAIIISVTAVFIFGEVLPQAICTRYGLAIGAKLLPLVYFLMGVCFIITYPLSKLLDCCFGTEHRTFFRRAQLKALIDIHGGESQTDGVKFREDALTQDEVTIIKGCLDMKSKTAKDAMLNINEVFMLDINAKLDYEIMNDILTHGHSRVPVFETDRNNIVALLLTKTLIKLDPEDAVPVRSLIGDERYSRSALFVNHNMPLFDLLNLFQTGKNVLEELLQEEIEDETDMVQELSGMLHLSKAKIKKSAVSVCVSSVVSHYNQDNIVGTTPKSHNLRTI